MAPSAPTTLKLYTERAPKPVQPPIESVGSLSGLLKAFQATTGWLLRYTADEDRKSPASSSSKNTSKKSWSAPIAPGGGVSAGNLILEAAECDTRLKKRPSVEFEAAREMASAIAGLTGELMETRHALWQREADLAAGVAVFPHRESEDDLAARLQTAVKSAANAIEAQAAALYLLDESTSELKLRACWGLPFDRFTAPARRLQGSLADLEALLGHAVVLENTSLMPGWNAPEDFAAAICVPVSSSTTVLGTFWIFCDETRNFTDAQTSVAEIVAGKIASDLEREMLLHEGVKGGQLRKQWTAAERMQKNQLPSIAPLLDGWQIAGWAAQAHGLGGVFYDWFCLPDGLMACALGECLDGGLVAALSATALKAALRSHAAYHRQAERAVATAQSDDLDQFGGRSIRQRVFRFGRNRHGTNLLLVGGPALDRASAARTLGFAYPEIAALGRKPRIGIRAGRLRTRRRRGDRDLHQGVPRGRR